MTQTMAEVIAAHTADWTDWVTSETDHEHYRCLCGLVEWHVNSSIDYHQAHAKHVADELTKAGYGAESFADRMFRQSLVALRSQHG